MKLRFVFCLALLVAFLALPAFSQTYNQALLVGGVANTDVTDNFKISAQFEKLIHGEYDKLWSIYSITTYDLSGIQVKPLDLTHMQSTAISGFETIWAQPKPWLSMLGEGQIGVNAIAGETTGLAVGLGPGVKVSHNAFVAKAYGKFIKTNVNSLVGEFRVYAGVRF